MHRGGPGRGPGGGGGGPGDLYRYVMFGSVDRSKMSLYQSRSEQEKLVDFLLPSGILIPLKCKDSDNLGNVKDNLWEEAKQFPLFGLRQPEWYTLVFVNCKAEQEECLDESQRLGELMMYKPLFKVHITSFNL